MCMYVYIFLALLPDRSELCEEHYNSLIQHLHLAKE